MDDKPLSGPGSGHIEKAGKRSRSRGRRPFFLVVFLVFVAGMMLGIYSLTQSPYLTRLVQDEVLPAVKQASGVSLTVEHVAVNPFPLYVELRRVGLVVPGTGGYQASIARVRAYLSLRGIFARTVTVSYLWADQVQLPEFPLGGGEGQGFMPGLGNGQTGESTNPAAVSLPGGFRLQVLRALAEHVSFRLTVPEREIQVNGANAQVSLKPGEIPRLALIAPDLSCTLRERPVFHGEFKGRFLWSQRSLQVTGARLRSDNGDWLEISGGISERSGMFGLSSRVSLDAIQDVLGQRNGRDGYIALEGTVEGSTKGSLLDSVVDVSVNSEAHVEDVLALFHLDPYVTGAATLKGRYTGPLKGGVSEGQVRLKDGTIVGLTGATLGSEYRWEGRAVRFGKVDGELLGGRITGGVVDVRFDRHVHYGMTADVTDVSSHRLLQYIGWVPPHREGRLNGALELQGDSGDWKTMVLEGNVAYESDGAGSDPVGMIESAFGRFTMQQGRLSLKNVSFYGKGYGGSGEADVDLVNKSLRVEAGVFADDLGDLLRFGNLEAKGNVLFSGSVTGPVKSPRVEGEIRLSRGNIAGLSFENATGNIGWSDGVMNLKGITVRTEKFSLGIEGEVDVPRRRDLGTEQRAPSRLRISSGGLAVNDLLAWLNKPFPVTGTAAGDVYFAGDDKGGAFGIEAIVSDGTAYGQAFERAVVKAKLADGTTELEHLTIRKGEGNLVASGQIQRDKSPCLNVQASGIDVRQLGDAPESVQGIIGVDLECGAGGGMAGKLFYEDLRVGDVPFGSGTVSLDHGEEGWSMRGNVLGGRASLHGEVQFSPRFSWHAGGTLREDEYGDVLLGLVPALPDDFGFVCGGQLGLSGDTGSASGTFVMDTLRVSPGARHLDAQEPVTFTVDNKKIAWSGLTLIDGSTVVAVNGSLTVGKSITLAVEGDLDLSWLSAWSRQIDASSGAGKIVLSISGPWEKPAWQGRLSVMGGEMLFRELPFRLTDIHGEVIIDDGTFRLPGLSAALGGGRVTATGVLHASGVSVEDFHLDVSAKDVRLRVSPDLFVAFDGYLIYDGTGSRQVLSGDVSLIRALYTGRVDWRDWILKAKRQDRLVLSGGALKTTELNIHVAGRENIEIRNNMARTQLSLDVYLTGQVAAPRLLGRLEALGGEVYFRERKFEIVSGSAEFVDPRGINPILGISATTETQGYLIRLGLDGPIDRLTLSLFSEPPLSDVDILSLLTVGKRREDLENIEGAVGASEAASFLTGSLQDAIEGRIRTITGFDRFQVDPYVNKGTGAIGPRLTVGKRLVSDKINVSYSVNVGTTEEQVLRVEYFMNRNVSLVGLRDESGDLGVDVKLKVDFE